MIGSGSELFKMTNPDPTKAPGSAALFIGPAAQISNPETERVKRSLQQEILTVAKKDRIHYRSRKRISSKKEFIKIKYMQK